MARAKLTFVDVRMTGVTLGGFTHGIASVRTILDQTGSIAWLPNPLTPETTMAEEHLYELELTLRGKDKGNEATICREYRSVDAASADKAIREVWDAVADSTKARMSNAADPELR